MIAGTHNGVLAIDIAGGLVVEDIVYWVLAKKRLGEEGVCCVSRWGPVELQNEGCSAQRNGAHECSGQAR
jgi:hypothetical protein